jgi:hypothetical protein
MGWCVMTLSSLTLILSSVGAHGLIDTKQVTQPLTEANLLHAATLLLSGDADEHGRVVVALRASAP